MNHDRPLIISVAPNGHLASKADNPAVPYSPAEIADEIVRSAEAGASIAHVHARTATGEPTQDIEIFREIVERVAARSDIIVELSLGSGGFTAAEAVAPLDLNPLMATFPMEVRNDTLDQTHAMQSMAGHLIERGVRPGFAINSIESRDVIAEVISRNLAGPVPCVVISADPFNTVRDAARNLLERTARLPENAHWWVMKGGKSGKSQLAARMLAIGMGGHVRVGFEDYLFSYDTNAPVPSNSWFVQRMAKLADAAGRRVATPAEARAILKLI